MGAIAGLVLAGGQSQRMGTDKAFVQLAGAPLIAHVIDRLAPQCSAGLVLSANGPAGTYAGLGVPVVADGETGFAGPLAGVLAGMDAVAERWPQARFMVSAAADTPFIPTDLVARLRAAQEGGARAEPAGAAQRGQELYGTAALSPGGGASAASAVLSVAASGGRLHPVIALWPMGLRQALRTHLAGGSRRVAGFAEAHGFVSAAWASEPLDPFFNINTPDDLAMAQRLAGASGTR